MNSYLSILTIAFCLILPMSLQAVNPYSTSGSDLKNASTKTLTVREILQLSNKDLEQRYQTKLKWSQKIVLNRMRKKLKKKANKDSSILETKLPNPLNQQQEKDQINANSFSLTVGIIGLASILLLFSGAVFFAYLSIITGAVAIIAGLIGLAKQHPTKGKGIAGLIIGLGISLFWYWAFTSFG